MRRDRSSVRLCLPGASARPIRPVPVRSTFVVGTEASDRLDTGEDVVRTERETVRARSAHRRTRPSEGFTKGVGGPHRRVRVVLSPPAVELPTDDAVRGMWWAVGYRAFRTGRRHSPRRSEWGTTSSVFHKGWAPRSCPRWGRPGSVAPRPWRACGAPPGWCPHGRRLRVSSGRYGARG